MVVKCVFSFDSNVSSTMLQQLFLESDAITAMYQHSLAELRVGHSRPCPADKSKTLKPLGVKPKTLKPLSVKPVATLPLVHLQVTVLPSTVVTSTKAFF
jgi:hypothetical protein